MTFKSQIATRLEHNIWPLLISGEIKPIIHAVFPVAEASKAHELMESGEHIGKIVLSFEPVGS
jgi:NADPH2:quinone reductase